MYLGIDIGGTKTLVCALTNEGVIHKSVKFPTPKDYKTWKKQLATTLAEIGQTNYKAGCVAIPGEIDRVRGRAVVFGNLPWKNIKIVRDVQKIVGCPMRVENDAKLGGLSEAMLLKHKYQRVLYVTISTGVGIGLTVDQHIDEKIGDGAGRTMLLEHEGKIVPWETFGSGKAIYEKYGKFASEINDQATWRKIVKTFTPGFIQLISILEPEVIVIGGGAGHYLAKFHDALVADLKRYETPMFVIPPILPAKRPDEAVAYGCYDYAKQMYP